MDRHPIRVVAARTGLSPHLIRIWERRYGAVSPDRTGTNRRLYSDADIRRLQLLKQAVDSGESISQVSELSDSELETLVGQSFLSGTSAIRSAGPTPKSSSPEEYLQRALKAVERLDQSQLEMCLMEASVGLSKPVFMRQLIDPLMAEVGRRWHSGEFRVSHEHMASATVRTVLGNMISSYAPSPNRPNIICTTPAGQLHEIGALLGAMAAATMGWNVIYLGPSLPAEDIAAAVQARRVAAVALSLTYPESDPRTADEIIRLRRLLPAEMPILVGGRAVDSYRGLLSQANVCLCNDLVDFMHELSRTGESAR